MLYELSQKKRKDKASESRMRKVTDLEKDPLESKRLKIGTSTGTDSNRIKGGRWCNPSLPPSGHAKTWTGTEPIHTDN